MGCWETEVCSPAVARALRLDDIELEPMVERLKQVVRPSAPLRDVGRYLGMGLGSVVNVLNPEVIVLGGIFRALFPAVRDDTLEALTAVALEAPREQVKVVVPQLAGDAVLVGAAERAFEALLADPAGVLAVACRQAALSVAAPQRVAAPVTVPA